MGLGTFTALTLAYPVVGLGVAIGYGAYRVSKKRNIHRAKNEKLMQEFREEQQMQQVYRDQQMRELQREQQIRLLQGEQEMQVHHIKIIQNNVPGANIKVKAINDFKYIRVDGDPGGILWKAKLAFSCCAYYRDAGSPEEARNEHIPLGGSNYNKNNSYDNTHGNSNNSGKKQKSNVNNAENNRDNDDRDNSGNDQNREEHIIPPIVTLSVGLIYFTQDSISNRFRSREGEEGELIGKAVDRMIQGEITHEDFPMITVYWDEDEGRYYSLDNRRLWVLQAYAEVMEIDLKIEVKSIDKSKIGEEKFKISDKRKDGGKTIRVRNGGAEGTEWKEVDGKKYLKEDLQRKRQ